MNNKVVTKYSIGSLIASIFLFAMLFVATYAYFSNNNTGKGTYNMTFGSGLDITYILSTTSNISLTVNPFELQNGGESNVNASITDAYVSLTNDSEDYLSVTCTYEIYYEPTSVYTNSTANTSGAIETALTGTDSTNTNSSFTFNLNGVSTKTKIKDGTITASNNGTAVLQNWTFSLIHYNTGFNQSDKMGSTFGGNIIFKAGNCTNNA